LFGDYNCPVTSVKPDAVPFMFLQLSIISKNGKFSELFARNTSGYSPMTLSTIQDYGPDMISIYLHRFVLKTRRWKDTRVNQDLPGEDEFQFWNVY